jgi:hypothetical protein
MKVLKLLLKYTTTSAAGMHAQKKYVGLQGITVYSVVSCSLACMCWPYASMDYSSFSICLFPWYQNKYTFHNSAGVLFSILQCQVELN